MNPIIRDTFRLLTFRTTADEFAALGRQHLCLGLVFTWIAGIGRYWDNPRAEILQHVGVGSLLYIVVLSGLLWCIFKPLVPKRVSYIGLLTFVSLTSPPAVLYAIPVERFMSLADARASNVWFLAAVATWRVALLGFYLRRALGLGWGTLLTAGLLPLTFIVASLTALNLEHVVFRIMGGLNESEKSANDGAYQVVVVLTYLSVYAFIPVLIGYLTLVYDAFRRRRAAVGPG